ncbi:MAG TPA: hypothetical protein VFD45_00525 [Patescibacteria group bacterium]|nr:hypothetical protein [Patescibacteria group bacterium]
MSNFRRSRCVLISCSKKDKNPIPRIIPIVKVNAIGSEYGILNITSEISFWQKNKTFEVNKGKILNETAIKLKLTNNAEIIKT